MPDKPTDNEIVKALQNALSVRAIKFYCVDKESKVTTIPLGDIIDLINRQNAENNELQHKISELEIELKAMRGAANSYKAENERLKGHQKDGFFNLLGNCLVFSKTLKDYNDMQKGLKAEAYKEFAERLKGECTILSDCIDVYVIIDNLLKELVGDDNG